MLKERISIITQWMLVLVILMFLFPYSAPATDKSKANELLLQGAKSGDLTQVKAALDKGADINAKGEKGRTALLCAAGIASVDVVKLVLDKGADVNAKSDFGTTPIVQAAKMRSCDHFLQILRQCNTTAGKNLKDKSSFKRLTRINMLVCLSCSWTRALM